MTVRKTKRSQAQERAAADRHFMEQVRGDQGDVALPGRPGAHQSGAQPVAGPDNGVRTTEMHHVPLAAPSPLLGVSPILGDLTASSPPPVGSFTAPPVGPPAPAYASQAFTPVAVIEQDPVDLHKQYEAGMSATQQYPAVGQPSHRYPPAGQQPLLSNGMNLPLLLGPAGNAPPGDLVTCPECGELATVDAARRSSEDFCRNCDFPLFWARSTVILPFGEETGASLRRLPGTVGRAATAALMCPHCGEPNSPTAQNCVRCLLSMHPVEVIAPPLYIPPPEPELLPVAIGRDYPLWWILLVASCLLAIVLIVVWVAVN